MITVGYLLIRGEEFDVETDTTCNKQIVHEEDAKAHLQQKINLLFTEFLSPDFDILKKLHMQSWTATFRPKYT